MRIWKVDRGIAFQRADRVWILSWRARPWRIERYRVADLGKCLFAESMQRLAIVR